MDARDAVIPIFIKRKKKLAQELFFLLSSCQHYIKSTESSQIHYVKRQCDLDQDSLFSVHPLGNIQPTFRQHSKLGFQRSCYQQSSVRHGAVAFPPGAFIRKFAIKAPDFTNTIRYTLRWGTKAESSLRRARNFWSSKGTQSSDSRLRT